MKTKMYKNVSYGDWVTCSKCGETMLLPCGSDKCPECGSTGCLAWASGDDDCQEMSNICINEIEYTGRSLNPYEYDSDSSGR